MNEVGATDNSVPTQGSVPAQEAAALPIPLDRDLFMRTLIRELAGTLQEVVGLEEASGFISVVGQNIGQQINQEYRVAFNREKLTQEQVAAALVDLKRRIHGDFSVVSMDANKIVFTNRACPFGDKVIGRPAMCMMTSNVFGSIAAENLGYAKVELQKTIALGHPGCSVVVHLELGPEAEAVEGREYFRSSSAL